jgi:O-acetylhomoserine/O-acetylserine sulfhydrylase
MCNPYITILGTYLYYFREPAFETVQLHGGQEPDPINGSRAVPLFQTCSYNFTDAADGASKFAWAKDGYVYSRMGNPTLV